MYMQMRIMGIKNVTSFFKVSYNKTSLLGLGLTTSKATDQLHLPQLKPHQS